MVVKDSPLNRFIKSMEINYDKWHDGVGYDLEALEEASEEERKLIETLLVTRRLGWRDVQALAFIGSSSAVLVLTEALTLGNIELDIAILTYSPELIDEHTKTSIIIKSLRTSVVYGGLTQTLAAVESYHPPEVVQELFNGLIKREGEVAVLYASMLFYIFGKVDSPHDDENRSFYLRFKTEDKYERAEAYQELCKVIGVDPEKYL